MKLNSSANELSEFTRNKLQKSVNTPESLCSIGVVDELMNDRMTQTIESCMKSIDNKPSEITLPEYKNVLDKIPKNTFDFKPLFISYSSSE
jgi:hypothetical protein